MLLVRPCMPHAAPIGVGSGRRTILTLFLVGQSSDGETVQQTFPGPYDVCSQWPMPILMTAKQGFIGKDVIRLQCEQELLCGNKVYLHANDFTWPNSQQWRENVRRQWRKLWLRPMPAGSTLQEVSRKCPFITHAGHAHGCLKRFFDTWPELQGPATGNGPKPEEGVTSSTKSCERVTRKTGRTVRPEKECVLHLPSAGREITSNEPACEDMPDNTTYEVLFSNVDSSEGQTPIVGGINLPGWSPEWFYTLVVDVVKCALKVEITPHKIQLSDLLGGSDLCPLQPMCATPENVTRVANCVANVVHAKLFPESFGHSDPVAFTCEEARAMLKTAALPGPNSEWDEGEMEVLAGKMRNVLDSAAGGVVFQSLQDLKDSHIDLWCIRRALERLRRSDAMQEASLSGVGKESDKASELQLQVASLKYFDKRIEMRELDRQARKDSWSRENDDLGRDYWEPPESTLRFVISNTVANRFTRNAGVKKKAKKNKQVKWQVADETAHSNDSKMYELLKEMELILGV